MHLASLNADVIFHFIKFLDPVSRFNLILSGILKGFENVSKVINVEQRIENVHIVLRPCRDRMSQLEIRSLKFLDNDDEALLRKFCEIFKRLVGEGVLKNNRELCVISNSRSCIPWMLGSICSMKKLDTFSLQSCSISLQQLSTIFCSCPELVKLSLVLDTDEQYLEMDDSLKNKLQNGFKKLKCLSIHCIIDNYSWPAIIEIVTWLEECVELSVSNAIENNPICVPGSFSILNLTLAQNLQSLHLDETPLEFIKLILPSCLHINTLSLGTSFKGMDSVVEIDRLKKLKELHISGSRASDFREILRNCHQVEKLKFSSRKANLKDITEWAAENMTEVDLAWDKGPSIRQAVPVIMKWRQLRKATLRRFGQHRPSSEAWCDFIMRMKHLKYLRIATHSKPELKPLIDKIKEFVLPRRPNFHLE